MHAPHTFTFASHCCWQRATPHAKLILSRRMERFSPLLRHTPAHLCIHVCADKTHITLKNLAYTWKQNNARRMWEKERIGSQSGGTFLLYLSPRAAYNYICSRGAILHSLHRPYTPHICTLRLVGTRKGPLWRRSLAERNDVSRTPTMRGGSFLCFINTQLMTIAIQIQR
jgi:hypothetical protein